MLKTEHLPECAVSEDAGEGDFTSWMIDECICDRLRACEARVTAAAVQRVIELPDLIDAGFAYYMNLPNRAAVIDAIRGEP